MRLTAPLIDAVLMTDRTDGGRAAVDARLHQADIPRPARDVQTGPRQGQEDIGKYHHPLPSKDSDRQREVRQEAQRNDLLSGPGMPNPDDPYTDDPSAFSSRTRLLAGTERLEDGSRRLDNAQRIALETEDVGADILRNLRGQREQIEHTRDTVRCSAL